MSGLRKGKKYDWKDSNMALFGSDTEKQVKKESAETEPAWKEAGQKVGLKIWRINTYQEKDSEELNYDVHFWIGKESTQDEYGTAAYKTVELDTFLDDKPIQHREVEGHESNLFKTYFKDSITYMKGGADTGFRKVLPEEYKPRLFHVRKETRTRITLKQIAISKKLDSNDVYILDTGATLYQWNGKDCSKDESFKAAQHMNAIEHERNGRCTKEVIEEENLSDTHPFHGFLNAADDDDEDDDDDCDVGDVSNLLKVSDEDGSLDCEKVKEGPIALSDLDSKDVMIIDQGKSVWVWVGKGASIDERKNAMGYAHNYLSTTEYPWASVSVVAEGQKFMIPNVA